MKIILIKTLRKLILSIFTILLFAGVLFAPKFIVPSQVEAQATCDYVGQCLNNKRCICPVNRIDCMRNKSFIVLSNQDCGSAIIGGVEPPSSISLINQKSGGDIGLIFFISRVINFANILAGILTMFNFVYSGFLYITGAGNASNMAKINERMLWSVVGILMIVGSYTLAAIFGLIFYADPTFIINPQITSAI